MIRRNDTQYSKFWMGDDEFEFDPKRDFDAWDTDTLLRLASFKRAVANFVRIVTGKNIPVIYNTGEQSYTEGKHVVLSAKLEHNQFDTAVGTALHEATHCVLTDFHFHQYMLGYFRVVMEMVSKGISRSELRSRLEYATRYEKGNEHVSYVDMVMSLDHDSVFRFAERLYKMYNSSSIAESEMWSMCKLMENWVEDRRIDYFQFTTSPGYKGYYNAMYSSYFWSKLTSKALRAKNYARTETWKSYKFRVINLLHPDTDFNALKGLREIWDVVDIYHINRLKSSFDSWSLALKIIDVIVRYIDKPEPEKSEEKSAPSQSGGEGKSSTKPEMYDEDVPDDYEPSDNEDDNDSSDGGEFDKDNDTGDENLDMPDGAGSPFGDADKSEGESDKSDKSKDSDDETLSDAQQKKMEKEEKKQEDFLDGTTPKKKMSKQASNAMKSIEESGVSLESVGQGLVDSRGKPFKIQCVVIRKVTKELIDSGTFSEMFHDPNGWHVESIESNQKAVEEGFRLGTMLGKKLQIRNETRTTRYSRLETGRIDKKLLASLGYENANVFFRTMVDKFNPMVMHISVDASGSMGGKKWKDTLTLLVSIIKAASMTANLDVLVSMRGTTTGTVTSGRLSRRRRYGSSVVTVTKGYGISTRPLVAIVYDSRVDKLSKVMSLFKYISAGGSTPEGLAFEPIIDEMVVGKKSEIDSVFVNISDGQPQFSASIASGYESDYLSYSHELAAKHTAAMVQRMRLNNIKVLSYIIQNDNWKDDSDWHIFKMCYGKDARKINTKSIVELARTLNEKFLEKTN